MGPKSKKYPRKASSSKNPLQLPQGLPNIGNSCFLNSILQQLFRLEKIREELINHTAQYEESQVLGQLCKLFVSMKNKDPIQLKEIALRKMQESLPKILLDYEIKCQYDSFETVIAIINELTEINAALTSLFEIQYTLKCQCSQMSFTSLNIESQRKICSGCEHKLTRKITKLPRYLVCHGSKPDLFELLAEDTVQKDMNFRLLSKNIYIGNKETGHYYSICYNDQKAYKFDDKIVTEYDESKTKKYEDCVFAIYQVSEDEKQKKFKRSGHLNKDKNRMNIKPAKETLQQKSQRIVYFELDKDKIERYKDDQRIKKANYISQRQFLGGPQDIQRSSFPTKFTIFMLFANLIRRTFELVSNRYNILTISFTQSYILPRAPIWQKCLNFTRQLKILSSFRNRFCLRPQLKERRQSELLT